MDQFVENGEVLDLCEEISSDESEPSHNGGGVYGSSNDKVVIDISSDDDDDVRKDGRENGEIDFSVNNWEIDLKGNSKELEQRIGVIRVAFECVIKCVIKSDFEESYDAVCYGIKNSLDSLWEVILEDCDSKADELVEFAYCALTALNNMFVSMSRNKQEENKHPLSRLLLHVTSQNPPLFATEQMKEIEHMIKSLESCSPLHILGDSDMQNKTENDEHFLGDSVRKKTENDEGHSLGNSVKQKETENDEERSLGNSVKQTKNENDEEHSLGDSVKQDKIENDEEHSPTDSDKKNKIENDDEAKTPTDFTKVETSSFRGRGQFLPLLLDLHKVQDEDSLPSPTRDTPSIMPPGNAVKPSWPAPPVAFTVENAVKPYYESHALKAFSSYQKKFGHNSLHMSDLPSPTPSEDADVEIGDIGGEVSSSFKTVKAPSLPQLNVFSSRAMDICSSRVVVNMSHKVPVKSSAKIRDPRLRVAKLDTVSSRMYEVETVGRTRTGSKKRKASDKSASTGPTTCIKEKLKTNGEPVSDGTTAGLKKQKTSKEHVSNLPTLKRQKNDTTDFRTSLTNIVIDGSEQMPGDSISNIVQSESIIKGGAVNPREWLNLIKTEPQKLVRDRVKSTHVPSSNSILGEIRPVNFTKSSPRTHSMDELGKHNIKPRDPRRDLHSQRVKKVGSGDPNGTQTSSPSTSSSHKMRDGLNTCQQVDRKLPPLKSKSTLHITRQFIKNLKDLSGIVSLSQDPSPQPSQDVPETLNNLCETISLSEEVSVGPSLSQNAWGKVEHLFKGFDEKQKAAFHNERARRINEQNKMFAARKLCLVLDLDHTLLNSAKFVEVDPVHEEILRKREEQDRKKPYRHLFRFPHMGLWTKLRPGVWKFLEKASKLFELHIYTMGNKMYATEMAKLLDPEGTLFSGRVISRGDNDDVGDLSKTKDLEGVLGMESAVVIIDDSIRVWPHNKLNLIVVERYIYFPCSRRQFGLSGPSLLEIDHDERPEAGTLASSLAVVERIHENFFAHGSLDEADVRNILASEQRKILRGCRIVFSRVFPIGETHPHRHPLWKTAEQFGAKCTNHVGEKVTHVVATSLGTEKVNWARSTGRFVVHPGWVEASALLYRRANEQDFAIKP